MTKEFCAKRFSEWFLKQLYCKYQFSYENVVRSNKILLQSLVEYQTQNSLKLNYLQTELRIKNRTHTFIVYLYAFK